MIKKSFLTAIFFWAFFFVNAQAPNKTKVIFIHGLFFNKECWTEWEQYFQQKGFECVTPAWPGKESKAIVNRVSENHGITQKLSLTGIVNYYDSIITAAKDTPILIGHSMGGLVVQLLLQRGKGKAGIAIHSAPPQGVKCTNYSYIKSNWPVAKPFKNLSKPYLMSYQHYQYALANQLNSDDRKKYYKKLMTYESLKIWKAPTTKEAKIDYQKSRLPLLFLAGESDRIIPNQLNFKNYSRYKRYNPNVSFRSFKDRGHMVLVEKNWQEVADAAIDWILKVH